MVARLVAVSPLTDIAEGGVVHSILGVVSDELSTMEQLLFKLWSAWLFRATGERLDIVVSALPISPRHGAQSARGGDFVVYRSAAVDTIIIPAGGLLAFDPTSPETTYTNEFEIVCLAGALTTTLSNGLPISFVCTVAGSNRGAAAGLVAQLRAPYNDVYGLANATSISDGTDGETDSNLQARAWAWVQRLGICQPDAIEGLVRDFVDSDGRAATWVRVVEYPGVPGYSEVLIDDGSGFQSSVRPGTSTSGIVPAGISNSRFSFWFEAPAFTTPRLAITHGGTTRTYVPPNPALVIHQESGMAWTVPTASPMVMSPGDAWRMSSYNVLTGYPKYLQQLLNSSVAHTGTRVRVTLPVLQRITLTGTYRASAGYSATTVLARLKQVITNYFKQLAPGQPLVIHDLHDFIGSAARGPAMVPGLIDVTFDQTNTAPTADNRKLWVDDNAISLTRG